MTEFKDWKEYINQILIDSRQFENPTTEFKGDAEIETFKSTEKNSLTEIIVGYFKDNLLITLDLFNPLVPGYNRHVEGDYFEQGVFDDPQYYGKPGLIFNEQNRKEILSILEKGERGKEIQYVKDDKILKSKLIIWEYDAFMNLTYDFTNRSLLKKIFGEKIEKMSNVELRKVDLNTIFNGIKNVL